MTIQMPKAVLALIVVILLVGVGALVFMAVDNAGTDTVDEAIYEKAVDEVEGLTPCNEVTSPADLNEDGECLDTGE